MGCTFFRCVFGVDLRWEKHIPKKKEVFMVSCFFFLLGVCLLLLRGVKHFSWIQPGQKNSTHQHGTLALFQFFQCPRGILGQTPRDNAVFREHAPGVSAQMPVQFSCLSRVHKMFGNRSPGHNLLFEFVPHALGEL